MGGSFNPPTIAHLCTMQAALDGLHADKGIFVPVSHAYLKRKMHDSGDPVCFSESFRSQMLWAMCVEDPRLEVSEAEYGMARASSYATMTQIQKQYPDGKLFFLIGVDKLDLLEQWAEKTEFFSHFGAVILSREGVDPMERICSTPALFKIADRLAVVQPPMGMAHISSTAIRAGMREGTIPAQALHPVVLELLKSVDMTQFREEITRFQGEYAFLSNLYPCHIVWEGMVYPSVESTFQASRVPESASRTSFVYYSPEKAREKGGMRSTIPEWEAGKCGLMKELLLQKFSTSEILKAKLKATEEKILINGNNGKDSFWGTSLVSWDGENQLGKLLMEIREELRAMP